MVYLDSKSHPLGQYTVLLEFTEAQSDFILVRGGDLNAKKLNRFWLKQIGKGESERRLSIHWFHGRILNKKTVKKPYERSLVNTNPTLDLFSYDPMRGNLK